MKKLGFKTVFKTPITLGKDLGSNKKDKLPNIEKEGVYSLKCKDCEAIYVGKTERNLKIRLNEHIRDYKNKKYENSFAEHLNSNNHSFPEGIRLIKGERDPKLISAIESLEILKSFNRNSELCLNNQIELSNSNLLKMFANKR